MIKGPIAALATSRIAGILIESECGSAMLCTLQFLLHFIVLTVNFPRLGIDVFVRLILWYIQMKLGCILAVGFICGFSY